MNTQEVIEQSKNAYRQWAEQWRKHAAIHKQIPPKSFEEFRNSGIGKSALLVANGYSLERNIETIKNHRKNVDIICCDKTLGHLLDNGIEPYICIVCDANVDYDKYLKPWKDKVKNTIIFNNVCGNPKWTLDVKWKDVFMYVNKDVMENEKEFCELSGCMNTVTAGTNVSNMMVVLMTQSCNDLKQNIFAYDKLILIGFDYSWVHGGSYYAFDKLGGGKYYYMKHIHALSHEGNVIYASNNLHASASWLKKYINVFHIPVVQCSNDAIESFGRPGKLENHITYRYKASDSKVVKDSVKKRYEIEKELKKINNNLGIIAKDHYFSYLGTL